MDVHVGRLYFVRTIAGGSARAMGLSERCRRYGGEGDDEWVGGEEWWEEVSDRGGVRRWV